MQRRAFLTAGLSLAAAPAAAAVRDGGSGFTVGGRQLLLAYQGFVEQHLSGVLRALHALAQTSDAQSGEWARMQAALRVLATESATYATVWLAAPDGAYSSLATAGQTGLSLADRPYFQRLMAGADIEGDLVVSKSTGRYSAIMATPITAGDKIVGAIGASIDAQMLSELVKEATELPADLYFYALDEQGKTAIHRDPKLMAQFPSDFGSPSMRAAVKRMLTKTSGVETYDFAGSHRTALFNWSDATRWRFVLVHIQARSR